MLHLKLAEVVNRVVPGTELFQRLSKSRRGENMAAIATIHNTLSKVDPVACEILGQVDASIEIWRTTVVVGAQDSGPRSYLNLKCALFASPIVALSSLECSAFCFRSVLATKRVALWEFSLGSRSAIFCDRSGRARVIESS